MAFSSTLILRKEIAKGVVLEKWTWDGASVTTGTITPDTTDADNYGIIRNIILVGEPSNNADHATYVDFNNDLLSATFDLTFTSNDTGSVSFLGLVS